MTKRHFQPCLSYAIAAFASFPLPLPATASEMVSLLPVHDNTLFAETTSALSNGSGEFTFAGTNGLGVARRGLIRFNVGGTLPAGSVIESVMLTLHMSRSTSGTEAISLHRLLSDWGEGASDASGNEGQGAAAQLNDATWLHRFFPGTSWSTPGGNYSLSAGATLNIDDVGFYTWSSSVALVGDVQSWVDNPASEFGWILLGNEHGTGTAKRFDTRENVNAPFRPVLSISYTPEPSTGAMGLAILVGILRKRPRRGA